MIDISAENKKNPGRAGVRRKHGEKKPMAAYIEIKEIPQKRELGGSIEEGAGWLFVRK